MIPYRGTMIAIAIFTAIALLCIVLFFAFRSWVFLALGVCLLVAAYIRCLMIIRKQHRMITLLQTINRKQPNETEQLLQTKLAAKRLQLRLLQNQINPHFLYNTLDSIRGHAMLHHQDDIAKIIECLSRYFRYCISRDEQIVTLDQEIRNVQDYFYIQHYRFGDRISLDLHIEDESQMHCLIPKTVLQPLIENAILHGLEPMDRKGSITLSICFSETMVYISISDTGVGIPQEKLKEINRCMTEPEERIATENQSGHGVGLQNVNERVRLCFGSVYGLRFHSVEGAGTDVQLHFPKVDDSQFMESNSRLREYWGAKV